MTEEKKQALENYFARQLKRMKHFDDTDTKVTFFKYCCSTVMMADLSSPNAEEQKALEILWDEWRPKLEKEAYGR